MSREPGSVSRWIGQVKDGDAAAAQHLWERYFHRLVGLARKKLGGAPGLAADEEDVALSALASFCRGAARGRFPQLHDRDSLWRLLVTITSRKARDLVRDECRQKRGGREETSPGRGPPAAAEAELEHIPAREPTPEFAAQVAEECRRLLHALGDEELRSIALWKMEGETTEQIAARLRRAPRTVERKLRRIRIIWEQAIGP